MYRSVFFQPRWKTKCVCKWAGCMRRENRECVSVSKQMKSYCSQRLVPIFKNWNFQIHFNRLTDWVNIPLQMIFFSFFFWFFEWMRKKCHIYQITKKIKLKNKKSYGKQTTIKYFDWLIYLNVVWSKWCWQYASWSY